MDKPICSNCYALQQAVRKLFTPPELAAVISGTVRSIEAAIVLVNDPAKKSEVSQEDVNAGKRAIQKLLMAFEDGPRASAIMEIQKIAPSTEIEYFECAGPQAPPPAGLH